ncbi:hypothetical protein [Ktedonobacter racemifer]|uniref:Uncharacterized protein n=1 Tax=Ktedonobacter racemifer DSM 44963 TaxID=485913 RepID=D6TH49_KTERA|nr:hypothetical protein [Ktedonobacter racemifer]EFH90791.1 hypothetical protein Krac_12430 [Ktedonobacter racemifer DSM 44963]
MKLSHWQTMKLSFEQIRDGMQPWVALGNFMNNWYAYHADQRAVLIADPLPPHDTTNMYVHRWAVFCVAAVEWFARKYGEECPAWVFDEQYTLSEPWFFDAKEKVRKREMETTPEEFSRRKIYCGGRVFANKWELDEEIAKIKQLRQQSA